jgi:hypothetical protein
MGIDQYLTRDGCASKHVGAAPAQASIAHQSLDPQVLIWLFDLDRATDG